MDLNEKLAQRRKEREQEAAVVQAEIAAKEAIIKAANAKTEFEKQVALCQLAYGGKEPVIATDTKQYIEKEQMIEKMAWSRWTGADNLVGIFFVGATFWGFFQHWLLGVIFLFVCIFYCGNKNEKYKKQITSELSG